MVLAGLLPVHPAPDVLAQAVDVHPGVDQADVVATRHLMQNFAETSKTDSLHRSLSPTALKLTSQLQSVTPSGLTPDFLISVLKLSKSVITFLFLLFLRH